MMRILLLSLLMSFSAGSAFAANNNPLMRACRIDQGVFWILQADKEYPMCFFDNAGVGALDFFKFKTKEGTSLAIQVYKSKVTLGGLGTQICEGIGAARIHASDTSGQSFELCQFSDGSLIEESTLAIGPGSVATQKLDRALSSTY